MTPDHEELRRELGAYVLGGLEPGERDALERHVEQCRPCRDELTELAALPGLLRRLPEAEPPLATSPELPGQILAAAAAQRRARRRRAHVWQAAAVAAVVAGGALATVSLREDSPEFSRMAPVVADLTATASAAVEARSWGTALEVDAAGLREGVTYVIVAVGSDGREEQAGAWGYSRGRRTHCAGSTSIPRDELAAVEIRTVRGLSLLRLETV